MTPATLSPDVSPPSEALSGGPRRHRSIALLALIPLATLAFVMYFVRLPYFVLGPGPARDVEPLIHIRERAVYPSAGHLLLTAVTVDQANLYSLLDAWVDPAASVVAESDIRAPGETEEEEVRVARAQMDTSQIDAAVVALSLHAGYPGRHRPGALVERVFDHTPADGKLFPGDVIVAVDGRRVKGPEDLGRRIRLAGEGTRLRMTVRGRPGGAVDVTLAPARLSVADRPVIGVSLVRNFPFPVSIESGNIGGPSAGLMWILGLIDLLTPGDLTGGRSIAGTGEIDPQGRVLPILGIAEKVAAAEQAGADVFFAPAQNAAQARGVAAHMAIVPVAAYQDALAYLQRPRAGR